MKPEIRQQQLMNRMRAVEREWRVDELARALKVSPLTIRRDLDALERTGAIVRTLGGCLAIGRTQNAVYQKRVATRFELKQAVGRAAARQVHSGDTLLINDGSTTFHLASCLGGCGPIMVYTNSVAMIGEFSRFENVRLFLLGGEYHRDLYYLGGGLMAGVLDTIRADTVFLGADGVDARGNCLALNPDVARDAQIMLRQARRKILLADATKVGNCTGAIYSQLTDFDLWVTTVGMPRAMFKRFRKLTTIQEVTP
ncbi:MAG: DeoR/GlpR family DNA-binding transcription regulator [Kiritimatiellae bacterium]|nr:DeoR/GlpR family DNA-binding transcription regulator [Kiritimatiellia bacterium]